MGGFENLIQFKERYDKMMRGLRYEYGKVFIDMKSCFIFDNDLEDSGRIVSFLEDNGHMVQLCDPNIEGLLLEISGKQVRENTKDELFRKKIKKDFESHFCCEAHEVKEVKLKEIFTEDVLREKLPVLYSMFKAG